MAIQTEKGDFGNDLVKAQSGIEKLEQQGLHERASGLMNALSLVLSGVSKLTVKCIAWTAYEVSSLFKDGKLTDEKFDDQDIETFSSRMNK